MPNLNNRLKDLRIQKKLSQKILSEIINISTRNYQRYEYGERDIPSSTLIRIADFFDVSLDYLVGRTDNPNSHKK